LRCRPSAQSKGFTHAQYQRFIDALDESIYNLRDMFPDRVVFGRVGEDACALNYHVWGANAGNWNLRAGQRIFGSGMAAVMGVQREGVFGIVIPPVPPAHTRVLPARCGKSACICAMPLSYCQHRVTHRPGRLNSCDFQVTTPLEGPPDGGADPMPSFPPAAAPRWYPGRAAAGGDGGSSSGGIPRGDDGESYDATAPKELRPAQLQPKEQGGFSSAGALTLRRGHGGEPEVLLGMEYGEGLKPLGGKRDHSRELPLDVACREFCEETGFKLDKGSLRALFSKPPARQIYLAGRQGKYVLYVARPKEGGLAFAHVAKHYNSMHFKPHGAEAAYLTWVSWAALVAAVDKGGENPTMPTTEQGAFREFRHPRERISGFLAKMVKEPLVQQAVQSVLNGAVRSPIDTLLSA